MSKNDSLYFEELEIGDRFMSAGYTMTEPDIINFAFQYDPQPFHLDVDFARDESLFGGLIASGFHTFAVCFRMMYQSGPFRTTNIGGKGFDEMRWTQPVRPGDTLKAEIEVLEKRLSSRGDRGDVIFGWTCRNQKGETVMTMRGIHIIKARAWDEK